MKEFSLHFFMRNHASVSRLLLASLKLGEKVQALHHVLDSRVLGQDQRTVDRNSVFAHP